MLQKIVFKRINAYMTVEATFIVSSMIMLLMLVIYWTYFVYNRCVVYQDCYTAALRGSQMVEKSDSKVEQEVNEAARELLSNQIRQNKSNPVISIYADYISVSVKTSRDVLLSEFGYEIPESLELERNARSIRAKPADLIRKKY